jgi:hypothetical protein
MVSDCGYSGCGPSTKNGKGHEIQGDLRSDDARLLENLSPDNTAVANGFGKAYDSDRNQRIESLKRG